MAPLFVYFLNKHDFCWRKEPVYGVLLPEIPEEPHVITQDEELEPLVVAAPAKYTRQVVSFERELAKLFFLQVGPQAQIHEAPVGNRLPHCFDHRGTSRFKSYKRLHTIPQAVVEFWRELSSIFWGVDREGRRFDSLGEWSVQESIWNLNSWLVAKDDIHSMFFCRANPFYGCLVFVTLSWNVAPYPKKVWQQYNLEIENTLLSRIWQKAWQVGCLALIPKGSPSFFVETTDHQSFKKNQCVFLFLFVNTICFMK